MKTKLQEWQYKLNEKGGTCDKCHRQTDYLTVDHIVPYNWIVDVGLKKESADDDWNFQSLCRPCNKLKGAMWDFTDPRTIENLRRYVDKIQQFFSA